MGILSAVFPSSVFSWLLYAKEMKANKQKNRKRQDGVRLLLCQAPGNIHMYMVAGLKKLGAKLPIKEGRDPA